MSQAPHILEDNRKAPTVRVPGTGRTKAGVIVFFDSRRGDGGTRSGAEEAAGGGGTHRRQPARRFSRSRPADPRAAGAVQPVKRFFDESSNPATSS